MMIGKVLSPARGFSGMLRYLLEKPHAQVLYYRGVRGWLSADELRRDFQMQARMNPQVKRPAGHLVLSFSKEDLSLLGPEPDRGAVMRKRALEYLSKMRVCNTQMLMIRHFDREREGLHLHLVYNRVSDKATALDGAYRKYHNRRICAEMNQRYGYANGKLGLYRIHAGKLRGYDRARRQVKTAVKAFLERSDTIEELQKNLRSADISMHFKRASDQGILGVSYRYRGIAIKAVHTGKSYLELRAYFAKKQQRLRTGRALLQKRKHKRVSRKRALGMHL